MSTDARVTDAAADALRDAAPSSFWTDRADAPAPRARAEGPVEADLVVVGAGFTGLWTALALKDRQPSLSIVLIEASICGAGASGMNGIVPCARRCAAPCIHSCRVE